MSSSPIVMRLHMGDYLRDTEGLTGAQHGFYILLMIWYYSMGRPIPNDLPRIYRRVHAESQDERLAVDFVLAEFFRLESAVWMHKRIEQELDLWRNKTTAAQASANSRWEKSKKNNGSDNASALRMQSDGNASRVPCPVSRVPCPVSRVPTSNTLAQNAAAFARFWGAYPRKKSKGDALKAWKKLNPSEQLQDRIFDALERAKTSSDWLKEKGKYIPYPASWLNSQGWEDEAEMPEQKRFVV